MTSGQETWAWLIGLFLFMALTPDWIDRYIPFIVWFIMITGGTYNMLKNRKKYKQSAENKRLDTIGAIMSFAFFFFIYILYFHILT